MTILIVEDNATNGMIIRHLSRKVYGGEIVIEQDPKVAMLRCQREQFALVLVDHMMPGITGVEFTRALREMITYRSVPVVMVTADHSPELRRDAIEAGVTDFLTKPVEAIAFRHLISGLLLASGLNDSTAA